MLSASTAVLADELTNANEESCSCTCMTQQLALLLLTHPVELAAVHEPVAQLLRRCNFCQPPGSFCWANNLRRHQQRHVTIHIQFCNKAP